MLGRRPGDFGHPQWRRRWGVQDIQVFDVQVDNDVRDGYTSDFPFHGPSPVFAGGEAGGNYYDGYAQFFVVSIPAGATIDSAFLTVVCENSGNDGGNTFTNLFFEAADDPEVPGSVADHAGRTRTTASTAWDGIDMTVDEDLNSPDITAVVQEVVDRSGWNSGQRMNFFWDDDGSDAAKFYRVYAHEGTGEAIKLHVEFFA